MDSHKKFKMDVIGQPNGGSDTDNTQIKQYVQEQINDVCRDINNNIDNSVNKINEYNFEDLTNSFVPYDVNFVTDVTNEWINDKHFSYHLPNSKAYENIFVEIKLKSLTSICIELQFAWKATSRVIKKYSPPFKNGVIQFFKDIRQFNEPIGNIDISIQVWGIDISNDIQYIKYGQYAEKSLDHTIVIPESDYNKDTSISNDALCLLTDE